MIVHEVDGAIYLSYSNGKWHVVRWERGYLNRELRRLRLAGHPVLRVDTSKLEVQEVT